jgi:hypothetical protein
MLRTEPVSVSALRVSIGARAMGAYSTLYVSRKAALAKMAEFVLGGMSDDDLAKALNYRFDEQLRNFHVGFEGQDDEELERL